LRLVCDRLLLKADSPRVRILNGTSTAGLDRQTGLFLVGQGILVTEFGETKSIDRTWSMPDPRLDISSILRMLDELFDLYAVDTRRIYLTGLSDGGTFTYAIGLMCAKLFAGIAPIAAVLLPWLDLGQGKELPIFTVHGANDFIFPVQYARMACAKLRESGHSVLYQELPHWGHAYTYTINEQLILPWFATLVRPPAAEQ
jgi:phospholipase/carboxylesterase